MRKMNEDKFVLFEGVFSLAKATLTALELAHQRQLDARENLLLHVLTLLDLLHVKSAQVFLHKVRRYETNEWQNYPKHKPVHVVDMFGCIICELCHKLSIYEGKQFVYHVHHTLTLDLTNRVNNLGLQLIAHHSYRRYRDSSEDCD